MSNTVPLRLTGQQSDSTSHRESAMTSATVLVTNLLRCVLWLIRHGILVTGFHGAREFGVDRVTVTVAANPYLHRLFAGQCAWHTRRQDGALTVFTWFGDRFGVRIEWEEICAY